MTYLFLDIDGVLNIADGSDIEFNDGCVENLKRILHSTNATLIISSSRKLKGIEELRELFGKYDIWVYDSTPNLMAETFSIPRGLEIRQWFVKNNIPFMPVYGNDGIRTFKPNASFCIIDDDGDMLLEQRDNFIQTDAEIGIDKSVTDCAISILNNYGFS